MILKAILGFLILLLVIMGIPSICRLYKEAGGTIKHLLKFAGCSIIALVVIIMLVIIF